MSTFSRRDLLLSALSATAVGALPGLAFAASANATPADAGFTVLLDQIAEENVGWWAYPAHAEADVERVPVAMPMPTMPMVPP